MHKWKAAVSHRIWTILPWWAAEFCELAYGIWQNLPRKTVGPTFQYQLLSEFTQFVYFCTTTEQHHGWPIIQVSFARIP